MIAPPRGPIYGNNSPTRANQESGNFGGNQNPYAPFHLSGFNDLSFRNQLVPPTGNENYSRQTTPDFGDNYGATDTNTDRKSRKNNREKQRREELNQQFESLCVLLGLHKKSEKYSVMAEAIQTITSLRQSVEEHKLMNTELRNELHNAALQANIASLNHNAGPQGARNSAINIGDAMESTTPAGTAAARRFSSFHSHAPTQDYGHPRRQSSIHTDNAFGFQGNPAPQQAADLTSLFTGSRATLDHTPGHQRMYSRRISGANGGFNFLNSGLFNSLVDEEPKQPSQGGGQRGSLFVPHAPAEPFKNNQ